MSTFNWEVFEPADETELTVDSGQVHLADVQVVAQKTDWDVKPPNPSLPLEPQPSGEINLSYHAAGLRISRGVVNFALIIAVLVLGFIIVHDTVLGKLTFEQLVGLVRGAGCR